MPGGEQVLPPGEDEKYAYLRRPQHRWLFWAQAAAFIGVAASLYGLARNTYWTLFFLVPLFALALEQVLAVRTSTFRRQIDMAGHRIAVRSYKPKDYPSVDVFLPTAGEPLDLLANTYAHVARLEWPGILEILILDDAGRPEVRDLAERFGFGYLARPGSEFKKAGNLQYAYERSVGDHITILDADFVPRPDYLLELVPHMADPAVGIVQSPQYFATDRSMSWLERCAGATQELFYRCIQPSRDAVGAAICVGTSALYRRQALQAIGGFPLIGHSEDVYTGVGMGRAGYRVRYVPVLVSRGRSPDRLAAFIAQQYRWCEGSISLMVDRRFHLDESMTIDQRLSFWSGFVYYVTTAMNAVLAPLGVLVMVWFFPDHVAAVNMLPLLGATLIWLVVLPLVSLGRWRIDVLRVQVIYGFAHLFCILDLARGKAGEWVATNAATPSRRSVASRVRVTMAAYLSLTQAAIAVGLLLGAWEFGMERYWANIVLAVVNAYVFVPVAWLALRGRPDAVGTQEAPVSAPSRDDAVTLDVDRADAVRVDA